MGIHAKDTTVPVEKTRDEIEATLKRYGADQFAYGWDAGSACIGFRAQGRFVKFVLPIPDRDDKKFKRNARGGALSLTQQTNVFDKAVRQRWRALLLVIKAKLEAVQVGITTFEDEFLSHITLPSGESVGQWLRPQIAEAYRTGKVPSMLMLESSATRS